MLKGDSFEASFTVYGIYEIDENGKVIDADLLDDQMGWNGRKAIGSNFFDFISHFRNADELRRRFTTFKTSRSNSESFTFRGDLISDHISLKIMFTRSSQRRLPTYFFYIRPEDQGA